MLSTLLLRSPSAVTPAASRVLAGAASVVQPGGHDPVRISAIVLTKDSARRLPHVLAGLAWCDEVVVLDTGSSDATLDIAARFVNVRAHALPGAFPGFGKARRHAVALARNDWILAIDSDEVVSVELAVELMRLRPSPRDVFAMPFHNHFNGRWITSCGWYPDRHERLFNRTATNFCESDVHERVQTKGLAVRTLSHPVDHYSYESFDDFLRKMRTYAHLFAEQHAGRRRSGPGKALRSGLWAFFKSYLLQRGCLQGWDGLVVSIYKSQSAFWKYLLLHDANRQKR